MVAKPESAASLIDCTLGNYAVDALLGRGASSVVYLARDLSLHRRVALKVLLGSVAREPRRLDQFRAEARATAVLQHPNIVRIFEAGVREGIPFIAMEYIEGETLERFLLRQGRLPWQNGLHIAQQVALALDAAHRSGILHRDIKPSNILLDRHGNIRLTDFGLAAAQEMEGHSAAGTPDYMSPEQCGGEQKVSASSDLFSLGVLLYRMLAGVLPFSGETALGLMQSILADTPPRLNRLMPDIPDDVARLVAHLLEKRPEARPASAEAVAGRIHQIQQEDGGASALPAALNAFIREQARPQIAPDVEHARTPLPGSAEQHIFYTPVSLLAKCAAVLLVLLSVAGAAYWHFLRPSIANASVVMPESFVRTEDGQIRVRLPHPSWRVEAMRWMGTQPRLVIALKGEAGSALHGARGLLAFDAEGQELSSLCAPAGPMLTASAPVGVQYRLPLLPALGESSVFHGRFPLPASSPQGPLVLQSMTEDAEISVPLAEFMQHATGNPLETISLDIAFRRDGRGLILAECESGQLAVFAQGQSSPRSLPLPPGLKLVPRTLCAGLADGELYFLARNDSGAQSVWAYGDEARLLWPGDFSAIALAPSGERMAVQGESGALSLLDLATITATPLGSGNIGPECWRDQDRELVMSSLAVEGRTQIIALRPARGETAILLESSGRVAQPPACSRGGTWIAFSEVSNGVEELRIISAKTELEA